jgi:hypothetical protein
MAALASEDAARTPPAAPAIPAPPEAPELNEADVVVPGPAWDPQPPRPVKRRITTGRAGLVGGPGFATFSAPAAQNLIIRFPEPAKSEANFRMSPELARRYGLNPDEKTQAAPPMVSEQWRAETRDLDEDLTVMQRILEKAVEIEAGAPSPERALGIVVTGTKDRRPAATYLQGHGAVFLLNVPFPLSGPEKTPVRKEKPASDSVWEETRKEIFDPARHPNVVMGGGWAGPNAMNPDGNPPMEYDPERVETLKQSLISALKSGANIRHMKPGDLITVVVQGEITNPEMATFSYEADPNLQQRYGLGGGQPRLSRIAPRAHLSNQGQQLVLQVSRGNINQLAEDKIKPADFARCVQVALY